MESWPCGQPAFDAGMFVRGVVVNDQVHLQVLGHVLLDLSEEIQIFLMPVPLATLREHFAVGRIQGGKQRGGPVTSIIVGHSLDVAQSHRQHRLGTFQAWIWLKSAPAPAGRVGSLGPPSY